MVHFEKFLKEGTGRIIMSVILGIGLASLFRQACKGHNCLRFIPPNLDTLTQQIFKVDLGDENGGERCVAYETILTKCDSNKRTIRA